MSYSQGMGLTTNVGLMTAPRVVAARAVVPSSTGLVQETPRVIAPSPAPEPVVDLTTAEDPNAMMEERPVAVLEPTIGIPMVAAAKRNWIPIAIGGAGLTVAAFLAYKFLIKKKPVTANKRRAKRKQSRSPAPRRRKARGVGTPRKRYSVVDGHSWRRVYATLAEAQRVAKTGAAKDRRPFAVWTVFDQQSPSRAIVGQYHGPAVTANRRRRRSRR